MDEVSFVEKSWCLRDSLLWYARAQAGESACEDLVSSTFTTLWSKASACTLDFRTEAEFRALAFTVLRGHIANEIRSRARRRSLVLRLAQLRHETGHDDMAWVDDLLHVASWLAVLSPEDQRVIVLHFASYSTPEIAQVLDCTPGAASKRLTRAHARLRQVAGTPSAAPKQGTSPQRGARPVERAHIASPPCLRTSA